MSDTLNRWRILFSVLLNSFLVFGNSLAKKNFEPNERNLTGREIGYFWHLSDVFFDPIYSPSGTSENDCHVTGVTNFTKNCGFFGEPGQCSAFGLIETIARAMNSKRWKIAGPEFCIFTGNLRCPNRENQANEIYETMSTFITDIRNAGFVNVYPSYGWYDYHPYGHHPLTLTTLYDKLKNLLFERKTSSSTCPVSMKTRNKGPRTFLTGTGFPMNLAEIFRFCNSCDADQKLPLPQLPNVNRSTLILGQFDKKTGYFSRVELPHNKIRVIVMNTNFYLKNHIASRLSDPAGQWEWLRNELKGCRMALQKAFIVMSVPPGIHGDWYGRKRTLKDDLVWSDQHNRRYIQIISEYHDAIAAQFAGHRHEDTFRLVYDREGKAISVILLAPAINPSFGNDPAMRIYMYDKNSGEILDFVQYFFDLTKANLEADMMNPEKYWETSYSFRDFYLLSDATVSSFEKLVKKFRKNDAMFQRYYKKVEGPRRWKYECEGSCKLISFCEMTNIDLGSFFECISGQSVVRKQKNRPFQAIPEALRNRLIKHGTNSVSGSVIAATVSQRHIILDIICTAIFSRVMNLLQINNKGF